MASHTGGCLAASAGIALAAGAYHAAVMYGDVGGSGGMKGASKALSKIIPYSGALILIGSAGSFLQASKTPANKNLWLLTGALILANVPYTYVFLKDDITSILNADKAGKSASVDAWKRMSFHTWVRGALAFAGTGLAIYALAKKK